MSKETGGSAFPTPGYISEDGELISRSQGVTLRDYFAAKAMTAFIPDGRDDIDTARQAYAVADAMLEARK